MLAMVVKAETRSKARMLHFFATKKILVNEKFSLNLEIDNVEDPFPGGHLELWEEWPNGQVVYSRALW